MVTLQRTDAYEVACIQNRMRVVVDNDPREQARIIALNVRRLKELMAWTHHQSEGRVKLMLTGEYALTGTYRPRSVDDWLNLAVPLPNEFTAELGAACREYDCYLATQFMERDPDFPGLFFDTAFLIGPDGEIALRYRKHNGPNNLATQYTAPGDVYDRYVQRYGPDGLFPVADTPIGKLGCMICYDVNFPEVARCLALNGAEVILHLTASTLSLSQHWRELTIARAWENVAFLVSCDAGPWTDSRWPTEFAQGRSLIVTHAGDVIGESDGPGERVIIAEIDLDPLRRRRVALNPHQVNPFCQLRSSLYAAEYARAVGWPLNAFAGGPMRDRGDAKAVARALIDERISRGLLLPPRA